MEGSYGSSEGGREEGSMGSSEGERYRGACSE